VKFYRNLSSHSIYEIIAFVKVVDLFIRANFHSYLKLPGVVYALGAVGVVIQSFNLSNSHVLVERRPLICWTTTFETS
jgi:hypothetical protein